MQLGILTVKAFQALSKTILLKIKVFLQVLSASVQFQFQKKKNVRNPFRNYMVQGTSPGVYTTTFKNLRKCEATPHETWDHIVATAHLLLAAFD